MRGYLDGTPAAIPGNIQLPGNTKLPGNINKPPVRIVLVEDHAILREGLKALIEIESDFDIVGEFGSVEECLDRCRPTRRVADCARVPQRYFTEYGLSVIHLTFYALTLQD